MFARNFRFLSLLIVAAATLLATVDAARAAADEKPRQRPVVLRPSSGTDGGDAAWESLLAREIGRQGLLMAARDQLGLTTRDLLLREGERSSAEEAGRLLDVRFSPVMGGDLIAVVRRIQGDDRTTLLDKRTPCGQSYPMPYKPLLDFAERLSRREYVDALKKAGFAGMPIATDESVRVPQEVERLLSRMSIPAQFAAVRELHALARSRGYSDELLGALVRGYANLSMFSELHWSSSNDILKARALLYAHRMKLANDRPFSRWHRAYAWAIAGLHAEALHDLAAAEKMVAATKPDEKPTPPTWLPLVEAVCRFETEKADFLPPEGSPYRELAMLLSARNTELTQITPINETSLFDPPKFKRLREFAEALPHCSRLGEAVHERTSTELHDAVSAAGRRDFAVWLYRDLDALDDLPRGVRDIVAERLRSNAGDETAEYAVRAKLFDALHEAGVGDEESEPSWSLLGTLLEDTTYMWCHCEAGESDRLDEDARADLLALYEPMLVRHPYREIVQIYGINWNLRDLSYSSVLESIDVANVTYWGRHIYRRFPNNELIQRFERPASRHLDDTYAGLAFTARIVIPQDRGRMANALYEVSPYAPLAVALKIETDWNGVKQRAAEWETRYADERSVMRALGLAYFAAGKNVDAVRCLKRYSDVIHDIAMYQMMDAAYRRENDADGRVAMWEEACRVSRHPQMLSQARAEWMHALMDQGRFADAIQAADGMQNPDLGVLATAAECAEYRLDLTEADRRFRRLNEMAPDTWAALLWWSYCERAKRDDLDAAKAAAQAYVAARDDGDRYVQREELSAAGRTALAMGEKERGARMLEAAQQSRFAVNDAWHQLLLAIEAHDDDAAKTIAQRIHKEGETPPKTLLPLDRSPLDIAVQVASAATDGKPLDAAAVKKSLERALPDERVRMGYFVGRFYELSGDREAAKTWYRESVKVPRGCLERTLACVRLRQLGEEPLDVKVAAP